VACAGHNGSIGSPIPPGWSPANDSSEGGGSILGWHVLDIIDQFRSQNLRVGRLRMNDECSPDFLQNFFGFSPCFFLVHCMHCTALHCISVALHCMALRCFAFRCIAFRRFSCLGLLPAEVCFQHPAGALCFYVSPPAPSPSHNSRPESARASHRATQEREEETSKQQEQETTNIMMMYPTVSVAAFVLLVGAQGTARASAQEVTAPAADEVIVCGESGFKGDCHTFKAGDGIVQWPDTSYMTSVWVGQNVKLSVENKIHTYFLPVGGPQGNGKYYMDVDPNYTLLYSGVPLQVEPFDDQQPYVAFEAVVAAAGSCTLDAAVGVSDGVLALTPWPAPENSPPRGLSIADMTSTVEYGWGRKNLMYVSAGATVKLFTGSNYQGESTVVIGPQLVCMERSINLLDLSPGKVQSMQLVPTWAGSILADWRLVIQSSDTISQTVTVGYEWETEKSSTNSFSDTFTSRADAGFKLGPFGADASVTDVTARSTVNSIRADTKVQKTDSYTAGCTFRNHENASYVALWQFVMSGPQQMPGASAADASVFSRLYTCTYSNSGAPPQPKCLPALCKDDLCQTCCATLDECSSSFSSSGAVEATPLQRRASAAKKGNLRGSNKEKTREGDK
jgi:hypothetical protein